MSGDTFPDPPRLTGEERDILERFLTGTGQRSPAAVAYRYLLKVDAYFSDGDDEGEAA